MQSYIYINCYNPRRSHLNFTEHFGDKRLKKLIEHMEKLPPERGKHFNMAYWATIPGRTVTSRQAKAEKMGLVPGDTLSECHIGRCGTTACAAGHAAVLPYFRKLGLELKLEGDGNVSLEFDEQLNPSLQCFVEDDPFRNLGIIFGVPKDNALILFGDANFDMTPREWARRARKCLNLWNRQDKSEDS